MATIYNSDLIKELTSAASIQVSKDKVPNQIAEKVVPVIDVNPKLLRRSVVLNPGTYRITNATAGTLFTTDANRDTTITGFSFSYIKDTTSTATQLQLRVTINGAVVRLIEIAGISLTAADGNLNVVLPFPIKIDRNTNVTLNSDTAVANFQISAVIYGYVVDTSNA